MSAEIQPVQAQAPSAPVAVAVAGGAAAAAPAETAAMRAAFREQIRAMARARADDDEDYDPSRYADVMRFLYPNRSVYSLCVIISSTRALNHPSKLIRMVLVSK